MKIVPALSLIVVLAFALLGAPGLLSQEGHPLTGTWSGDWGPSLNEREHLTLVLRWDGDNITGLINPGLRSVTLDEVSLDVTDWTVRLRATSLDGAGGPVAITAEGRLEDLESPHRTLRGTWRQGDRVGDFVLTRE